jgi:uncharacterized membrane protein
MTIYLKSVGMGLLGAVVAVIGYVLILALFVAVSLAWQARSGSGGIGAVSSGLGGPMIAAVAGFVVGFVWRVRRRSTS